MTKREALTILGLRSGATPDEIKSAYRKRAMSTHPDKGGDQREFERVVKAHNVLTGRAGEDSVSGPLTPWIQ